MPNTKSLNEIQIYSVDFVVGWALYPEATAKLITHARQNINHEVQYKKNSDHKGKEDFI